MPTRKRHHRVPVVRLVLLLLFASAALAETYRVEFINAGDRPANLPAHVLWYENMPLVTPKLLTICVGDSVEFVNNWEGQVNVFSYSSAHRFDLGRFRPGESRTTGPFPKAGLVRVYDEIHSNIKALILVVDCDPKDRTRRLSEGMKQLRDMLSEEERERYDQLEGIARERKKGPGQEKPKSEPDAGERSDFPIRSDKTRSLQTVTFETPAGQIIARFTDDTALGDEISGTVIKEPKGQTESERKQNLEQLRGYALEAEGIQSRPRRQVNEKVDLYHWSIPPQLGSLALRLKHEDGRVVGRIVLPPPDPPPVVPCPLRPLPGDYYIPTLGQPRRPVEIYGPFPGDPNAIYASIGGQTATLLAKSPRKAVFESPANVVGPAEIVLRVGDLEARGPFRNLAVKLSTSKPVLRTNEEGVVTGELSGLERLKEEIEAQLDTFGAVTMQGGNSKITVRPSDIQPGGKFTFQRSIRGNQPGGFQVTVIAQNECGQVARKCQRLASELSRVAHQSKGSSPAARAQMQSEFDSLMGAHAQCLNQRGDCGQAFFKPDDAPLPGPCEAMLRGRLLLAQAMLNAAGASRDMPGVGFWQDQIKKIEKQLKECEEKKEQQATTPTGAKENKPEAPGTSPQGTPPTGKPQTQPSPESPQSPQPRPSPSPQSTSTPQASATPIATPRPTESGTTPLLTNKKVTAADLEGQTVHIEGDPRPGVKGIWLIKIKAPSGAIVDVFLRQDDKPNLKLCDWIKVGKAHDGFSNPVIDGYDKVEDPTKKAAGAQPGDTKPEPSPEPPKPTEPTPTTPPVPPRPPDTTEPAEEKCKEGEKKSNRRIISCEVSDAVATELGYGPSSTKIFNIGTTILRVGGAGRGVQLGKLLASAFSSRNARHLYIKLKIKYVDETLVCKDGKWVVESSKEGESETGWVQLFDSQGGGGANWLPGSTGADVEAAINTAKAANGCT